MTNQDQEPIQLGPLTFHLIGEAMDRHDNEAIWRIGREVADQAHFMEEVRVKAFNAHNDMCKGRTVIAQYMHSMLMWPAILPHGVATLPADEIFSATTDALRATQEAVIQLMGDQAHVAVLKAFRAYKRISAMEPSAMRQLTHQTANVNTATDAPTLHPFALNLPGDAPELVFLVGAMTGRNRWPMLPEPDDQRYIRAVQSMEAFIRFACSATGQEKEKTAIWVGRPQLAEDAIEQGVVSWLRVMAETYGFTHWDAYPTAGDRVDVAIRLGQPEGHVIHLPLRTYQLGLAGLERVLTKIAGACTLAPQSQLH